MLYSCPLKLTSSADKPAADTDGVMHRIDVDDIAKHSDVASCALHCAWPVTAKPLPVSVTTRAPPIGPADGVTLVTTARSMYSNDAAAPVPSVALSSVTCTPTMPRTSVAGLSHVTADMLTTTAAARTPPKTHTNLSDSDMPEPDTVT
jgi:hypothetical protein